MLLFLFQPFGELERFFAQIRCGCIIMYNVMGFCRLLRNRHLGRESGFCFFTGIPALRHHPGDLILLRRRDAAYYIIFSVPMRLKKQRYHRRRRTSPARFEESGDLGFDERMQRI